MKRYGYPDAKEYLALARATTVFLCDQKELRTENNEFCNAMDILSGRLYEKNNVGFDFNAMLKTRIDRQAHQVRVGGCVEFKKEALIFQSYWIELFGMAGSPEEDKVLYRVHFDVAVPDSDQNNVRHPLHHIQLGGNAADVEYVNMEMKHWSSPRIPYVPLSLAMFLEIVFREFGVGYIGGRMHDDDKWRNIVKKNEKVMIAGLNNVLDKSVKPISYVYYEGL